MKKKVERVGGGGEGRLPDSSAIFPLHGVEVERRLVEVRRVLALLDADVAELYGVETREVNQAVRNNKDKFPEGYVIALTKEETEDLRSKYLTAKINPKSRALPKAFTERGLYMMATILKGKKATETTLAIIETFARVRGLKRELVELHKESSPQKRTSLVRHFGEVLTDIVMPDADMIETESTLELNFFIGKLKHTVRRVRKK